MELDNIKSVITGSNIDVNELSKQNLSKYVIAGVYKNTSECKKYVRNHFAKKLLASNPSIFKVRVLNIEKNKNDAIITHYSTQKYIFNLF